MRKVQDALGFKSSRFNQNRASPITEKNTGSAVFVIENGGHHVAADNERSFVGSIGNKLSAHRERIGKSRTSSREIEAPSIFCAQAILNQAGCRRKQHVRSDGGHDDEVDLIRLHAF